MLALLPPRPALTLRAGGGRGCGAAVTAPEIAGNCSRTSDVPTSRPTLTLRVGGASGSHRPPGPPGAGGGGGTTATEKRKAKD